MLKKLLKLFLLIFIFCFAFPAFAQEKIIDNAGLLSQSQKASLNNRINAISSRYKFDLIILTERNIGGSKTVDYADDFFDNKGYGQGKNRDGCLFLQVTETRDYWISTSGSGIDILNDYALNKLKSDVAKFLSAGQNYEAYNAFLLNWEEFLALDEKGGRRYNFFHQWNVIILIIAWALALAIGFITVQVWKSGMNTAIAQTHAAAYIVPGSLSFKEKKDNFLYSTVTKTQRQTENNSARSGGGSRTSSSGRSHGGGGGRY